MSKELEERAKLQNEIRERIVELYEMGFTKEVMRIVLIELDRQAYVSQSNQSQG